ncbi:MAG: ABC transporter permease [Sphingobacteriaceae bacterium]|nr:ABC transporter permease [Sphingobacteriaceae bacterium]
MLFFSLFKESIFFALHSLNANKLRTFLSLLGITIGIFAIIVVFTIVDSLENNIRKSIASLGDNVVFVQKWPWTFGPDYPWWKYMNRPVPQYDELFDIQKKSKTAEAVAYRIGARRTIKNRGNIVENAIITGCSYDYYKIKSFEIPEGRFFTENEVNAGNNVALLGKSIADGLFPNGQDPIGKEVKIAGRKAFVIGVFKKEGESMLGNSMDNQVVIPYHFAKLIIDVHSENSDPYIAVKARPGITNAQMIDELTGIMRGIRRLKPMADDDFALNETNLLSKNFNILFDIIGIAGWIIGGFSILVGGFGIANIMFVSVKERTSMIGIQKSLGAKNYFILMQFLSESVFLSLIGGVLGLFLTWLITLAAKGNIDMEITLTQSNIILGITISVLIGIVSGFVPAYTASQLDPVEAIRSN